MKGKFPAGVFKVMAVVSALAIGGVYVGWRQAEAEKANKRESAGSAKEEQKQEDLMMMVGSKNPGRPVIGKEMTKEEIDEYLEKGRDFIHPIPGIPEGAMEVSNVIPLLPGSKSISMPLFTKEQLEEMSESEKEGKLPELLPGSKVGIFIPAEPESEKSE